MQEDRQTVAILGGTVAGWMAAATLARRLPRQRYRVVIVETAQDGDGLGDFGTTLTALPSIRPFHESLGIDENLLLRAARGSFALGVAFAGWAARDTAAFLPFGAVGAPLGPAAFHQLLTRLRQEGRSIRATDYSIAAIAAQAGRFARPSGDARSVLSQYAYGLHIDSWGYLAAMRATAEAHGARVAAAPFQRALRGGSGDIAALELATGEIVSALLFVDATGASALLSGAALGVGFESWRHWLPCNQAIAARVPDPSDPPPFGQVEALASGWRSMTPLAGDVGQLSCTSSAFDVTDGVEGPGIRSGEAPHRIAFENGRRIAPWHRNCVAIGAAACVLEPLHPVALQLVQSALARLVTLFPNAAEAPVEAGEYNRMTINEAESARDFLIAQYATNGRTGEVFWDAVRSAPPPEHLAYKLALFASAGRMPMYDDEVFEEADWIALLDAQNVRPRRHDALAGGVPIERIEQHLARLREAIIAGVKTMPPHGEYLRRAHAAPPRGAAA
ncbi:MAG: Tryptophan halogenase [Sphingomonas bacterium]|uniref:tryptophan halogenase family protein n=1 Tax=Sphingomonas bacterium TaxID=1895847 RepID=UPI0026262E0F|nr:tryptophan halogenase family protein [Sphingomonas bacterium]MDB5703405.1 Tryptophan halogenase [Sphingomonas bacterium]